MNVPSEYDINSSNTTLLNAALVAGLYPKILSIDPATGQLRTVLNSQLVAVHPSSVNFNKKPLELGIHYLAYFTLMYVTQVIRAQYCLCTRHTVRHSKKLYAWETGPADDLSLVLLCGEQDFKVWS